VEAYRADKVWQGFYRMGIIGDLSTISIRGLCGTIEWNLSDDGTLTFSGTGYLPGYNRIAFNGPGDDALPWFGYANSITQIVINESVNGIGMNAFDYCSKVTKLINYRKIPQTVDMSLNINQTKCTLLVPTGFVEAYRSAKYWKDFINIEAIN
jgi:hypothetical protein